MKVQILEILIPTAAIALVMFGVFVDYIRRLRRMNANQKDDIIRLCTDLQSERNKRRSRDVLAVLGCGANVRFIEPSEMMNLVRGRFDEQTEPFRDGGTFIDCNPACPMRETCALLKSLGQLSLSEGFSMKAKTPGATLRADRHDGQWELRLVRHGDKWLVDVIVDGIFVYDQDKPLFVVPPLLQVLEKSPKGNRHK